MELLVDKNKNMSPINTKSCDPSGCNDLTNLKVDVGILKTQAMVLAQLCEKMDKVIEKLVENHDKHIGQLYQEISKRRSETDDDIAEIHERIDSVIKELQDTERRLMGEMKAMRNEIYETNKSEKEKLDKLLEWRWSIAGGIVVISWLISKLGTDILGKLFH